VRIGDVIAPVACGELSPGGGLAAADADNVGAADAPPVPHAGLPSFMNRELMHAPIQEQDRLAGTGHVLRCANLATRREVGGPAAAADQLEVALRHELGFASGADGAARRRLLIASPVPASKRPALSLS
jgi:hypothetical protein